MLWILVLVGFAAVVPGMLVLAALGLVLLSLPFLILYAFCAVTFGLLSLVLWPVAILFDPFVALVLALIVARLLWQRRPDRLPAR